MNTLSSLISRSAFATVGFLAVTLLAGCQHMATQPTDQDFDSPSLNVEGEKRLPADIATFLSKAAEDEQAEFSQSPWGSPATLTARAPYHAASGRVCRRIDVSTPASGSLVGIACQHENTWHWVRNVTR
ncbi:DVU3141 family protein [Guyparkeria sp. TX1]|uniref:DVU3141 family protein n=1 Tax=Guyparkeria sp. TX1 TaxID=3115001 RepID=UPI00397743FD